MSIASNFPAIKPSLLLDFSNTEELDSRITFTRASTATYYGSQTAKAEENLLLQSQSFENVAWGAGIGTTRTANTSTAPDGTTTADTITENSTTSAHVIVQSTTSSGQVTFSVFAKAGSGSRFLTISVSRDATHYGSATFDLSTQTATQTLIAGYSGSVTTSVSASTQGFHRYSITLTTNTLSDVRIGLSATSTFANFSRGFDSYLGDGTSSLILWGAQLEQRSAVTAYTPTTTQPITNYIPVLETAASGVARFDHNPTTFESLGLLIEGQRTNLVTYSEQFDNASWVKGAASIVANTIVAPDGTLTGDKLFESTDASTTHTVRQAATLGAAGATTFSFYVKAAECPFIQVWINDGATTANRVEGYVNLTSGATLVVQTVGTGWSSPTMSVISVGNGWWRVALTSTGSVTSVSCRILLATAVGTTIYTGDGYSGIYIWGAQLEAGAFATSYIPTVASQVTRASDAASMTGTNFSSWYSQGQGTLYTEFNPMVLAASSGVLINDNTTSNRIRLATTSVSDQGTVTTSGTAQAVLDGGTPAANTSMKLAMTYQVNNFALSLNGATATTDTSGTVPVVSQLQIGAETTTVGNLRIKKVAYYPIVSTATQLQALTS
jgi:hypothetical protein